MIASIIGIATPFVPLVQERKYEVIFAISIGFTAMLFIIGENLYLKKHWRRKKRYPEVFKILNAAFAPLNELTRTDKTNAKQIIALFKQCCDKIAEAFTKLTGTNCSVAIKVTRGDFKTQGYDIAIDTFVRDGNSMYARSNTPYQSPMTLEENSDFKLIYQNIKNGNKSERHFFSNDLIKDVLKGYKNSRLGTHFYDFVKNCKKGNGYSSVKEFWPLSYRSTIVVGIYPLVPDKDYEIMGFLCIDSPKKDVFFEYDQEILYGIADTMFNYIEYLLACYNTDTSDEQP